jgi:cytochrome c
MSRLWSSALGGLILFLLCLLPAVARSATADQPSAQPGDPTVGKGIFERRCTGCHALVQNREGPKLQGVFGRTSGTAPGYQYSPELIKAAIVWDESSLEKWLSGPGVLVPGTNMDFHVPNPTERRDLISFLKQTSGR